MKYLKYIIVSAIIVTTLIILTTRLYFSYSIPDYNNSQSLSGLQDTVDVYTDSFGVPYIYADNDQDLFYTAGYIIARERLFQLSLLAAVSRGEIATLLGDEYTICDDYIKQQKLFFADFTNSSTITDENELLINSFCSGINKWIDENNGKLPISFKLLNAKPIKWTSADVFSVIHMMTNNSFKDRQIDWFINTIGQYFGSEKLQELLGQNSNGIINLEKDTSFTSFNIEIEKKIWDLIGVTSTLLQSDFLILQANKTISAKAIVIFNDIGSNRQPAKWYEIHLNGGSFNIEGAVIPGFPIPVVGKNNNAAWAFNNPITIDSINDLFDIAIGKIDLSQKNTIGRSVDYTDTSGYFFVSNKEAGNLEILQDRLAEKNNISINDVMSSFSDLNNIKKAEIAHRIAKTYMENAQKNNTAVVLLSTWDGDESARSAGAMVINMLFTKLLQNVFIDEFSLVGQDIFNIFTSMPDFAERSLEMILNNSENSWIDNIQTVGYRENLNEIIVKSVDETINEINKKYGENFSNWHWGNVSTKIYKHVLSDKVKNSKQFNFNIGPFSGSGSNNNLNVSGYNYDNLYRQDSGISFIRIFDLSDMNLSYSILSTGQSGLPKSVHYSDQAKIFNEHRFRKILFNSNDIRENDSYEKLVLYPVE